MQMSSFNCFTGKAGGVIIGFNGNILVEAYKMPHLHISLYINLSLLI